MANPLRILAPHLRRYRRVYLVGAVCLVASNAFKGYIPAAIGDFVNAVDGQLDGGADAEPLRRGLLIAGVALATAAVRLVSRICVLGNSRRVAHDLRNQVFDHLLRLAPSFFVRNPTGQVMSRCINDMQNVQGLTGPVLLYLVEVVLQYVIFVSYMLGMNATMTLIAIAPYPLFLFLSNLLARRIQEGYRRAQNSLGEVSAKVDESLSGQLVIKTLALEGHDAARFEEHCREYRDINLGIARHRALLMALMLGLASLSTLLVLAIGGPQVARGEWDVGSLIAMVIYLQMLASPTRTLGFVISSVRRGTAALGRIAEILASEVTIESAPVAAPVGDLRGDLSVRGLTVAFPPLTEQPHLTGSLTDEELARAADDPGRRVLDDVSFDVPAGTSLGVVGHTGSGKSLLVAALARQLEVEPGRVFVDGVDLTTLDVQDYRARVGLVPQDAFLFSRSLADNVALGRPDATRAEIETAVEDARLAKDLGQLPLGLDTVVGERGVNLSGGQRQRSALARVLLLTPRVLLLDDTLSAVDTHTSEEILERLRPFASERTTVIVAHRLSTVQHADHLIVLEEGRVVERGSHAELLAAGGRYAALWEKQQRKEASAEALDVDIRDEEGEG